MQKYQYTPTLSKCTWLGTGIQTTKTNWTWKLKKRVMFHSSGFQKCHLFLLFRWSVEIFLGQLSKPTFEPIGKGADEKSSTYACDDTTIGHHTTSETRAKEFFETNASDLLHEIFLRCECIRCWKVHYIFSQNGVQVLMILFPWCWKNPYAWKVSKNMLPKQLRWQRKNNHLKMHLQINKMVIFQCHVSFLEGKRKHFSNKSKMLIPIITTIKG